MTGYVAGAVNFWVFLLLFTTPSLAAETNVHDLGQVKGAITQPQGRRDFAEQIEGKADPAPLGGILPAGLSRQTIISLIAPQDDPALVTFVGAKKWSLVADDYVAIVCAADSADDKKYATPDNKACDNRPDVFLGVIAMPEGGAAKLVARTPPGFVLTSDWSPPDSAPVLIPSITPIDPHSDTEFPVGRSDDEVDSFDLAPYRIAPNTAAFGVRSAQHEGYAGGGAMFQTLHLFVIDGERLKRVLAQSIYVSKLTAGDWNPNGTRQHQEDETTLVIAVLSTMTAGHYNLRVSERGAHNKAMLHWNEAAGVYWVPGSGP